MVPLVLVKSYGQLQAVDIIKSILCSNSEQYDIPAIKFGEHEIKVYKTDIVTKYYKTQIALFEWDDITAIPDDILENIEGVIIYFDPEDKSFPSELDMLQKFVTLNNIEASCFISKNISDSGTIYDEIKRKCKTQFAFIDLKESVAEGNNDEYSEVVDLLRNNVWSNVVVGGTTALNYSEDNEEGDLAHLDENDIERQLNDFEDLINSIENFKILSQNMSREDVLDNAEKLSERFAKMLKDD